MNKKLRLLLGIFALLIAAYLIFFILNSETALVIRPKGAIALNELELIKTDILLMLIAVYPALVLLVIAAWKYHVKNSNTKHELEKSIGIFGELLLWFIPLVIIAMMALFNWHAAHQLNSKSTKNSTKPLTTQENKSASYLIFPLGTLIAFEVVKLRLVDKELI